MRLSATKALLERRCRGGGFRVRDLRSGRSGSLPENDAASDGVGMLIDQRAILRRLAELQYTRNDRFSAWRAFRRARGEAIDIFPAELTTSRATR